MASLSVLLCAVLLCHEETPAQEKPAAPITPPSPSVRSKLLELYLAEARDFNMLRAGDNQQPLMLHEEPIYVWTNPLVANGQYGAVYVWTWQGRPEAIASIFVYNFAGARPQLGLMHEFHSISLEKLTTSRRAGAPARWQPTSGIKLTALEDAPPPAAKPAARLSQMRALAREFSVHSVSPKEERWELRLLPQPLFRYDLGGTPAVDGSLFTFVTSAGTDPELILVIESQRTGTDTVWQYGLLRFTGFDLSVERNGHQVWTSLHADLEGEGHNSDYTYQIYRDRLIPRPIENEPNISAAQAQ